MTAADARRLWARGLGPGALLLLVSTATLAAGPDITLLDRATAAQAITDDSMQPYFDQLQPMEMSAKTGRVITGSSLTAQREETRRRYRQAVQDFSDAERGMLRAVIRRIDRTLHQSYLALASTPWRFLKVDDTIEGGLPHTRGGVIVLSEKTLQTLNRIYRTLPTKDATARIGSLLVHEQVHVYQRLHPGKFDSLYAIWGMQRVRLDTGNHWLTRHHLANPDGLDCCWIMALKEKGRTQYVWPAIVFAEGDGLKRMPHDFVQLGIEVRRTGKTYRIRTGPNGVPLSRPLESITAYTARLPIHDNIYHPNETSAELLAQLAIAEYYGMKFDQLNPRVKAAHEWFGQHLN